MISWTVIFPLLRSESIVVLIVLRLCTLRAMYKEVIDANMYVKGESLRNKKLNRSISVTKGYDFISSNTELPLEGGEERIESENPN